MQRICDTGPQIPLPSTLGPGAVFVYIFDISLINISYQTNAKIEEFIVWVWARGGRVAGTSQKPLINTDTLAMLVRGCHVHRTVRQRHANVCLRRPACAESAFAGRHHISLRVNTSLHPKRGLPAFLASHLTAPPCRSCRRRSCRPARGWRLSPRRAAPVPVCAQRSAPTAR